jgi:hypothetical protein
MTPLADALMEVLGRAVLDSTGCAECSTLHDALAALKIQMIQQWIHEGLKI